MSIEKTLFASADKMRGAMDASEYKYIALGLLFLRYVSESFERQQKLIVEQGGDPEDRDEYWANNVFFVPQKARWSMLANEAKSERIGIMIDDAMRAIEEDNETLKGALPRVFGKPSIDRGMLADLIELYTNDIRFKGTKKDFDLIGRIYEYFIGGFASEEGKRGGEFYTPKSIVDTLVEMIEPMKGGHVYDPCCGTGGFFVQSEKFIDAHQGRTDDIAIFGQERNHTTFGLARMNLAIRGIFAKIRWNAEGTLLHDEFQDERFDYILANPPFNMSDWKGDLLREDVRWKFGVPPIKNANFAWIEHIYAHLSATGFGGVVMANGSMSSASGGEDTIRENLVKGDAVDCMVAMPGQLFYGTQIPACLWILAKDKSDGNAVGGKLRDRRGEVLFIDARKMGKLIAGSRKQKELSREEIEKIAATYHAWRSVEREKYYKDIAGFCKSATQKEIAKNNYILTPGRYVGAEEIEEDSEPFEEKFARLTKKLHEQFEEDHRLEKQINANLKELNHASLES